MLIGILTGFVAGRMQEPVSLVERIVEETVHNHELRMPLEVGDGNVESVTEYFRKLIFTPCGVERVALASEILGGRY